MYGWKMLFKLPRGEIERRASPPADYSTSEPHTVEALTGEATIEAPDVQPPVYCQPSKGRLDPLLVL